MNDMEFRQKVVNCLLALRDELRWHSNLPNGRASKEIDELLKLHQQDKADIDSQRG